METSTLKGRPDVSPIIVIGTGRSGTSAVAGMLHYMGVYMGDEFQPADYNNVTGHWEDVDFTKLNRLVLMKKISKEEWWAETLKLVNARQEEADKRCAPWGWKIPASTNLLPEYQEMLPNAQYVVCERDPEESVKSCMKAYGYTEELARKTILPRVEFMEKYMPDNDKLFRIQFNDLLEKPEDVFDTLAAWVDVEPSTERRETAINLINQNEKEANVMIGIPNLGKVDSQLMMRMVEWVGTKQVNDLRVWSPRNLVPHDFARNMIVKEFLESTECTHLFFIDADTVPPRHALKSLLRANKPVVTGCTPTMKHDKNEEETKKQYMIMREGKDIHDDEGIITVWGHGLEQVDFTGGSCLMIKREALEKLEPPYFKFQYNSDGLRTQGEDFYFCRKLKAAGVPLYANFDVVCNHAKEIIL